MKTTTSGRAFAKNIFDLFSTLMISLPIENHKILFRSYPNSFTAEDAISNLGGLQFIQSNHDADPKDPTRIITRVVTTQFSLSRDMAKNLCQTFMDARLFESAADPSKREFQNKGIYQITGKGAHIVEKFVNRNSLSADDTKHITANATPRIMLLERAEDEDAIILNKKAIEAIFKRFAGLRPNVAARPDVPGDPSSLTQSPGRDSRDRQQVNVDRCNGIEVKDQQHNYDVYRHTFYGKAAVDWLMDFTTVITKEEAICIAQEMVSCKYIEQVGEENRTEMALFRTGNSALYHFTELGRSVVGWESLVRSRGSSVNTDWMDERGPLGSRADRNSNSEALLSTQFKLTSSTMPRLPISIDREKRRSADESTLGGSQCNNNDDASTTVSGGSARRLSQILNDPAFQILSESGAMSSYAASSTGRESVSGSPYYKYREGPGSTTSGGGGGSGGSVTGSMGSSAIQVTTSNTTRLNLILSNATLRDLFKSFLKQNICEENLSFYLEVLDYKAKFNTLINTTKAYTESMAELDSSSTTNTTNSHPASLRELEKQICTQAFAIHETYLVSGAPRELNLPHQMRMDITAYMQAVVRNMETSTSTPTTAEAQKSLPSTPSSPSSSNRVGAETGDQQVENGGGGSSTENTGSGGGSMQQKELIHISLFDRIHEHIFRLMSTDSVPKFTRTNMYREVMMNRVKQQRESNNSLMGSISSLNSGGEGVLANGVRSLPTSRPERTASQGA
ncbi:hypothetical protein BGX28_004978 [Mortierella sp. GBA30]|nr:hypothetical protein BGX28_004978 [Mortierella sp. GBA30]